MGSFRKKIYAAAGYTTTFFGPGRPEFNPKKEMPSFETYLLETAEGTLNQLKGEDFDEGILGSFMPGRYINQGNIAGFLPMMVPSLKGAPCIGVEGACGTGGKAIVAGIKTLLSDLADSVFIGAFEMQNTMKSIYNSDVLSGADYYKKKRKEGHAYFFPSLFSDRAFAYYQKYGEERTRNALAKWYERAILNARKCPKAQEYTNLTKDLFSLGLTPPNEKRFLPHLNVYDCAKISDGAASIALFTEEGLKKFGVKKAVEIVSFGEAEGDITAAPSDLTELTQTKRAIEKTDVLPNQLSIVEIHDCFTITGLLSLEALGLVKPGEAAEYIMQDKILPINTSGGLIGFGHPTGASGVRQFVDLFLQLTKQHPNQVEDLGKSPLGMMISMGGNDKTVTAIAVKSVDSDIC
ncbi:hypothetical protein N9Y92_04170 [Chlamydiales bacterium]|nr:hypothetical protein [Chlamydiales bacterium]